MAACAVRRNGLSRSPTVGCGVFVVRAKISSPVATMRRSGFSSDMACRVAVKNLPHRDTKRAASFTWFLQRSLYGDAAHRPPARCDVLGPREIIGGQFSSVNSWYAKNILKGL